MAKLDFYDVNVYIGKTDETHYAIGLRVLFEDGDNEANTIQTVSDLVQTEALRIAQANYIETIDDEL